MVIFPNFARRSGPGPTRPLSAHGAVEGATVVVPYPHAPPIGQVARVVGGGPLLPVGALVGPQLLVPGQGVPGGRGGHGPDRETSGRDESPRPRRRNRLARALEGWHRVERQAPQVRAPVRPRVPEASKAAAAMVTANRDSWRWRATDPPGVAGLGPVQGHQPVDSAGQPGRWRRPAGRWGRSAGRWSVPEVLGAGPPGRCDT